MSAEKEKRKHIPSRCGLWKCIIIGFVTIVIVVVVLALLGPVMPDDTVKPFLDAAFVPTAEYLLKNPEPESEFVRIQVFGNASLPTLCVYYSTPSRPGGDLNRWKEIYLNNQRANFPWISGTLVGLQGGSETIRDSGTRCTHEKLEPGIHLLEIHLKYSPFEAPFHIHRWAFEIEE